MNIQKARLVDEEGRPIPSVHNLLLAATSPRELQDALVWARTNYLDASAATKRKWNKAYDSRMNELLGQAIRGGIRG